MDDRPDAMKGVIRTDSDLEAAMSAEWQSASDLSDDVAEISVTDWASKYVMEHYTFTHEMKEALAREAGLDSRPERRTH